MGLPGPYGRGLISELLLKGQSHFAKTQARESGNRGHWQGGQCLHHLRTGIHNLISGRWQGMEKDKRNKGHGLFPSSVSLRLILNKLNNS